ncbi:MAG: aminopeptidase [Candidatus Pacebacteria bacterium]|nr:aminopeptidase [Candidatus Paceibacterota bacterium]
MYIPEKSILENYARLMVNYALNHGNGIKSGETVLLKGGEAVKPLFYYIHREIIKQGGHVVPMYMMDDVEYNLDKDFFLYAKDHQIGKFESEYYKGIINEIDHYLYIIGENDPQGLKDIDPKKVTKHKSRFAPWFKWREEKELAGKFSWTLCSYGTEAMAQEANLSIEEYWDQIVNACYLQEEDVVAKWKSINEQVQHQAKSLNDMEITMVHITGPDIDLHIGLHPKAAWKGGSGANIPSFETWTSPDWRKTNGWIKCDNPWYCDGNKIVGVYLRFKDGVLQEARADENDSYLQEFLTIKNADKIGEFSLTDKNLSKITKSMADTLYDENRGGDFGNMHIALGDAYANCYKGDPSTLSKKDLQEMGFNEANTHKDIVLTSNHTVTITDSLNKENIGRVIKKDGIILI